MQGNQINSHALLKPFPYFQLAALFVKYFRCNDMGDREHPTEALGIHPTANDGDPGKNERQLRAKSVWDSLSPDSEVLFCRFPWNPSGLLGCHLDLQENEFRFVLVSALTISELGVLFDAGVPTESRGSGGPVCRTGAHFGAMDLTRKQVLSPRQLLDLCVLFLSKADEPGAPKPKTQPISEKPLWGDFV